MYGTVVRKEWLTPHYVRIAFTVTGLDAPIALPIAADSYVNIAIPPADAPYDAIFDPAHVREKFGKDVQPARRRYTVRAWRPESNEFDLDFVVHGDEGVAGPWASDAKPGDPLVFTGPSSGYSPDPDADWHLLVGDETALPAIATALEQIGAGVPVIAVLLTDGPEFDLELPTEAAADVRWLHRDGSDNPLLAELASLEFPEGRVHAFVHGEADEIRGIRGHLLSERGLERSDMSCSPYWRRTMTDEAWREVKRDFVAAMNAD